MVNLVDLHKQRLDDIVANELKARVILEVVNVALLTAEQVVHTDDRVAHAEQTVDQVGANKASTASN